MGVVRFVMDNFANHGARNPEGIGQQLQRRKGVGEISLANHLYLLLGDQLLYRSSWCAWHTDRILVIWELSTKIENLGIKILIAEMGIRGIGELGEWHLTLGTRMSPGDRYPLAISRVLHFATFSCCDIVAKWDNLKLRIRKTRIGRMRQHLVLGFMFFCYLVLGFNLLSFCHCRALPLVLLFNTLCSKCIPSNRRNSLK